MDDAGLVWRLVGLAFAGFGVYVFFRPSKGARTSAEWHKRAGRRAPWFYGRRSYGSLEQDDLYEDVTDEETMKPAGRVIGVAMVLVGLATALGWLLPASMR